jgi:single-strand DNA-binding protein
MVAPCSFPNHQFSSTDPFTSQRFRLQVEDERARAERQACYTISVSSISIERKTKKMSFNKIIIVGFLGRAPELKYISEGTAVCTLSVATTEKRKDRSGEVVDHTIWFRVSVWGRQAELANEYLAKGRQVYIEGRLRLEEYTDREGNPRVSPTVNATDIQFLGQRDETAQAAAGDEFEKDTQSEGPDERQATSKPSPNKTSNGSKRGAKGASKTEKETAAIGDEEIPF